jgi:hypothetical protein
MPLEQEPSLEILSKRIDELEMIVRQLRTAVEKLSSSSKSLPVVPLIPTMGSIGEKNSTIGTMHQNEHRLAWERATGAQ